jgi:hypothetical protein
LASEFLKSLERPCLNSASRWIEKGLYRIALLPGRDLHPYLGYRTSFQPAGWPCEVHVVGFDSAWLCGAEHEAGALLLTGDQVLHETHISRSS